VVPKRHVATNASHMVALVKNRAIPKQYKLKGLSPLHVTAAMGPVERRVRPSNTLTQLKEPILNECGGDGGNGISSNCKKIYVLHHGPQVMLWGLQGTWEDVFLTF